jgi:hypothetical protein
MEENKKIGFCGGDMYAKPLTDEEVKTLVRETKLHNRERDREWEAAEEIYGTANELLWMLGAMLVFCLGVIAACYWYMPYVELLRIWFTGLIGGGG